MQLSYKLLKYVNKKNKKFEILVFNNNSYFKYSLILFYLRIKMFRIFYNGKYLCEIIRIEMN